MVYYNNSRRDRMKLFKQAHNKRYWKNYNWKDTKTIIITEEYERLINAIHAPSELDVEFKSIARGF